jgi:hypothetical protein
MNFGSFKFFGFKNVKNTKSNFNFNKNTFKMFSCSVNMTNKRFVSLLSNKIHYVERIISLNNISKQGFASLSGNGMNLYSNPELSTDVEDSLTGEAMVGSGVVSPSIFSKITNLNDLMLICEGI